MPYTTPITDRTQSDIDNLTSKAYMNTADWERIALNAEYVHDFLLSTIALYPTFDYDIFDTDAFAIYIIPDSSELNRLTGNIENMRVAMLPYLPTLEEVNDNWVGGINEDAPDYVDVNLWEQTIDLIYLFFNGNQPRHAITGIARAGVGLTRNHGFRRY